MKASTNETLFSYHTDVLSVENSVTLFRLLFISVVSDISFSR